MRPSPLIDNRVQKTPAPIDVKSTPSYMQKEIERLKADLQGKDSVIVELQNENEKLKLVVRELENACDRLIEEKHNLYYELNIKSQRPFNERGAGRKSRITPEIENYVVELRQNGYSFADISNICAENGIVLSKSTVDRILRKWVAENSSQN